MPSGACACANGGCPAGTHLVSWGFGPSGCAGGGPGCCRFTCSDGSHCQCNPGPGCAGAPSPPPGGGSVDASQLLGGVALLGAAGLLIFELNRQHARQAG